MEHSVIPDAQRHEAKGASTASVGQVLRSNGDGTTSFATLSYSSLSGRPTASGYQRVISGFSSVSTQAPSATNTPLQLEFGSGGTNANVTLASNGTLTFNVAGDYQVTTFMRFGRTAASGAAILFARVLANGVQYLNSNSIRLDNADIIIPVVVTLNVTATAGMTMQWQIYRDAAGVNNGGLIAQVPSLSGWNASPTATLVVDKFVGLSA